MNDMRPDPDALLGKIQEEESRRARGRLKIFFGACPGVGKTYAMLEDARERADEGVEIVAGIVETHKRRETEALLAGLEVLPRRDIEYRGVALREFDLDAALARKPQLLLLDELAHTNAPGSRHARRWQDARELLAAGIDVNATLNVQHVESLNDVVAQITGVRQGETVPDSILEGAEEIFLVDLPPEELLKRLGEGKVYTADAAARAAGNFFKKQNLIALRELSLRFVAHRVNVQMQYARRDASVTGIWPTAERLLVCIGPSPTSARLIRSARRLAENLHCEWIALTVETPALGSLPETARNGLANNQRLAQSLGAEISTVAGEDMPAEVIRFARARNVTKIVVGKPALPWWRERLRPTLVDRIVRLSGDIDIYVMRGEGDGALNAAPHVSAAAPPSLNWTPYGAALAVVALCTAITWAMFPYFSLSDLIMVYLVGVAATASRGRRGPAVFASLLGVLFFDLLYVPPRFTLSVSDFKYVVTFAVMLGAGLVISAMALRMRRQAEASRQAHLGASAQNRLNRKLIEARGTREILEIGARIAAESAEGRVALLLPDAENRVAQMAQFPAEFSLDAKEQAVAQWSFAHGEPAGRGTDTLASAQALHLPMRSARETLGVMAIEHNGMLPDGAPPDPNQILLLEAFAGQIAMALEVGRLEERQRESLLQYETERMQNSILSSISHDLRTPLAAIMGSAESLLSPSPAIDAAARRAMVQDIHDETLRLTRLIENLLEITRIEGGALALRREPQALEEIVGGALAALAARLKGRMLEVDLPFELPLVEVDGILVQHVLTNLIENALNYASPDLPMALGARVEDGCVAVRLRDGGEGLAPGEETAIFEKFHRGSRAAKHGGSGLGLAICRSIVAAHGGRIEARNVPARGGVPGGAEFMFTLPIFEDGSVDAQDAMEKA